MRLASPFATPRPGAETTTRHSLTATRRRTRRTRLALAGGAAVVALVAGTGFTWFSMSSLTGTDAEGRVSIHAGSAVPTSVASAQAKSTLATASQVASSAQDTVDVTSLKNNIALLSDYHRVDSDTVMSRVVKTQTVTDSVQASADAIQRKALADAAAAAAATQAAADARAAAAAAAAQALAQGNTVAGAKATAAALASSKYGWGAAQFTCLASLWSKESGWSYTAHNSSGATGIPQALPGSKMASVGSDWATNATTQVTWGLAYIAGSYGSPCAAWAHSESVNWY